MSTQPLEQTIAATRGVLANVTHDQLGQPTPCASWDVAELINHIVGGQHFFAAGLSGEPPSGEQPDFAAGDFVAAFDDASSTCLAGFQAEGAMEKMYKLPFGEMPGAAFMGLACTDTFQHAWDLAKATGQETDLAPELAETLLTQSQRSIQESFRGPEGAPFGPEQTAPADAAPADQLAAFLGRTV
jgi:uncharacterized protein (TIGR03086 family)